MKKSNLLIVSTLLTFLAIFFLNNCKPPTAPVKCTLAAPLNLEVKVVPPDSAHLEWEAVPGAQGYRVVVIDTSLQQDTFGVFNTTQAQLGLDSLVNGHVYAADVSAKCDSLSIGNFSARTFWRQEGIVIEDVVMSPTTTPGMGDCNCEAADEWSNPPISSDASISLPNFGFPGAVAYERAVFHIQATDGTTSRTIKLAFDRTCNVVKILSPCNDQKITVTIAGSTIIFTSPSTNAEFLRMTVTYDLDNIAGLDLHFSSAGSLIYRRCGSIWTGYCN